MFTFLFCFQDRYIRSYNAIRIVLYDKPQDQIRADRDLGMNRKTPLFFQT